MLKCLQKLKRLRSEMIPPITSAYFFCTRTGERPYRGVDVIKEFAKEAGVSDLSVFTFTTLRKHVATLTQSFEVSKLDQDQLASFLGHDIRVHRSFYRRPIDIVEKAKVAKLLIAANKGICIPWENLDDEVDEELEEDCAEVMEDENNPENDGDTDFTPPDSTMTEPISTAGKGEVGLKDNKSGNVKNKKFTRVVWSSSEVEAVKRQLNHCILTCTVPKKSDAMKAIASEPSLRKRTWKNVKDYVYNIIKKQRK